LDVIGMAASTANCNALFSSVIVATTIFTLPCDFHIQEGSLLLHSMLDWDYSTHFRIAITITHSNWCIIFGLARSVVVGSLMALAVGVVSFPLSFFISRSGNLLPGFEAHTDMTDGLKKYVMFKRINFSQYRIIPRSCM